MGFKWIHGSTVKDGELRFVSVSSLQKADPASESGCPRAWWYQYVKGIKEPPSPAMERGTKLHAEVANYLITGTKNLSTQVLSNLHMVPDPVKYDASGRPDMFVEHDIVPQMPDGSSGLQLSPLRASGIPMVGAIDLMHSRGTNKGGNDIEDTIDPPGTVEVLDWKFVSKMDWAKPGNELINTIQMAGYAKYVYEVTPAKLVRISHGYMPSKGLGRKHTAKVTREQVEKAWEHPTRIASMLKDVAKETNPDLIEANTRACRAFGRECIHKSYCTAGMHNSLTSFFGDDFGNDPTPSQGMNTGLLQIGKKPVMNLLAHIQAKKAEKTEVNNLAVNEAVLAEIGKLAVEEAQAKGPGIAEICAQIRAVGLGFPTLIGSAAAAYTAAGLNIAGSAEGEIAHVEINDAALLTQVLDDAKGIVAQREALANPSAILPPDAPAGNVVTPAPVMTVETPTVSTAETDVLTSIAEPKAKKGRPKKNAAAPVAEAPPVAAPVTVTPSPAPARDILSAPLFVYIDAIPTCSYQSLWPIIVRLTDLMNEKSGAADFRIADPNGAFGFGKWKGILAALTREALSKEMTIGHYALDGTQGEVAQVVVETLREVVALRGGILVRGMR